MANNEREPNTQKRGRPANKLSVKLFLLDPDHVVTKVTKETCSKSAIETLMQNGYGPPQPGNERIEKNTGAHTNMKCICKF